MTICWLVRSMLAETGSWHGVGWDLESCHRLWKVDFFICIACSSLSYHFRTHWSVCLDSWNSALLEPVLSNNLLPSTMSTNFIFKCHQCSKYKLPAEYGTHQWGNRKEDWLSVCLSCSTANTAYQKQRHIKSNAGHPAKQVAAPHPMSPSDFVAALAEYTSTAQIDDYWHISVDETTLPDKDVANHLASLAWNCKCPRCQTECHAVKSADTWTCC